MKPVLVHYIEVGNLDPMDVGVYIESIKNVCNYSNEYHSVFIPVRNQSTKIECLNPIIFEEGKEKKHFINRLSGIRYRIKEIENRTPYMSKNILLTERIL